MPLRKILPALAALLFLSAPALAAGRALLVGVSDYPKEAVGDLQLQGPKNDVALMLRTLRQHGFDDRDIILLADNLADTGEKRPSDGAPTRAAIMAALDRLALAAQAGEQVVIMLSGHGSQAPVTNPASLVHHPDGMNPIFLPIDIGKWNDAAGAVENMIAGDEFGAKIAAIRSKRAFVWVIVDACHSGTITRGAEAGVLAKKVNPAALGVPAARLEAARKMAQAARPKSRSIGAKAPPVSSFGSQPAGQGGYVAFFAAHPDELALQRNLPKGYDAEDKRPHGILVFYLVQALRTGRAQSYVDLAQMVLAGYDQWGAAAPSPLFEGDLRADVLGSQGDGPRLFPVRIENGRLRLDAGALDDIEDGAIVALAAADRPAEPLGFARAVRPGASSATLEPVAHAASSAPSLRDLDHAGRLTAKVVERGVGLEMRVALPAQADADSADAARALEALRALEKGEEPLPAAIRFVAAPASADLFLSVADGRIWFSPATGEIVKTGRGLTPNVPALATSGVRAIAADIGRVLRAHLKVRNLIRAAEALGAGSGGGRALEIAIAVAPAPVGALASGARSPDDFDCGPPSLDQLPESAMPIASAAELPPLAHCDTVYFTLRNVGKKIIDVTPLYIDSAGAVDYMGPPEGLRLLPGAPARIIPVPILTFDRQRGAPFPVGLERLLFIAVEQEERASLPADFRYLQQAALPRTQTPRGGSSALRALLEEAAFGVNRTRSASAGPSIGEAGIVQFRWKVKAPE